MKRSAPLQALVLALTTLSAGTLVAAPEDRPRIESYPSSYEFLRALQAWNRAHQDRPASPKEAAPAVSSVLAHPDVANIDPTSELAPPPIIITGPENLDHAVEQAKSITHPAYKQKIRYHRTTHISFPLPTIDGQDMSMASAGVNMHDMSEEEMQSSQGSIGTLLDQSQRKLQGATKEIDNTPVLGSPIAINEGMLSSGPRGRVDITVRGH